jgi:hypothetical protein
MWKGYEMTRFPVPPEDGDLVKEMENLYIYTKKDEHRL